MSANSDLNTVHNELKAMQQQLNRNEKTLGWVLFLAGASIAVSILTFAVVLINS